MTPINARRRMDLLKEKIIRQDDDFRWKEELDRVGYFPSFKSIITRILLKLFILILSFYNVTGDWGISGDLFHGDSSSAR